MWREKYIRWNWVVLGLNVFVSLLQSSFTYQHWVKHEYWLMGVSTFFMCFNGYMAYWVWGKIKVMKEEYKQYVWRTLQTSSEVLR